MMFSPENIFDVYSLLATILHLGKLRFYPSLINTVISIEAV